MADFIGVAGTALTAGIALHTLSAAASGKLLRQDIPDKKFDKHIWGISSKHPMISGRY